MTKTKTKANRIYGVVALAAVTALCPGNLRADGPSDAEGRSGLSFQFGDYPDRETSKKLFDELDYIRGVEVWLRHISTASLYAMFSGMERDLGMDRPNQIAIWETLMDSNALFLTANTDSVYMMTTIDTRRDGPTVIEAPPGVLGALDDHYFRWVIDIGLTGPDKGEGGKYLILPPDYKGEVPSGYFVARPKTYRCWWFGRGQTIKGEPGPAVERFKKHTRVYSLAKKGNPPKMEFINASGKKLDTTCSDDAGMFEEVAAVVLFEHLNALDAEERGLLASIGIQKGKPFNPDARMRKVLERSAETAHGIVRALLYDTRDPGAWIYPDRKWKTAFIGGSSEFVRKDGSRDYDARSMFFYYATGITPAMALRLPGKGSQYLYTNVDKNGAYLDGGKSYRLHYPPKIPAGAFWSVVVYDSATRSMLVTDQKFPSVGTWTGAKTNDDGSMDFFFGPTLPEGAPKSNWIQTVPGKGWNTILRFYSPTQAFFDQSWRAGDIEKIK